MFFDCDPRLNWFWSTNLTIRPISHIEWHIFTFWFIFLNGLVTGANAPGAATSRSERHGCRWFQSRIPRTCSRERMKPQRKCLLLFAWPVKPYFLGFHPPRSFYKLDQGGVSSLSDVKAAVAVAGKLRQQSALGLLCMLYPPRRSTQSQLLWPCLSSSKHSRWIETHKYSWKKWF